MIQEKGKRRARRAPALLAAYLALALLAGCTGGAGSSAAEQNSASSSGAGEFARYAPPAPQATESTGPAAGAADRALPPPAAPQETVFSGASSSCLPSEPPEDAPETLGPGHFTSVQDRAEGEQDPYLELYADGTFMFMCNVYQGMTTYLGTWSYESGVLTLTRPSAEETYVFFAQDADTLLMHSGDLVMTQPGAVLTRLAQ